MTTNNIYQAPEHFALRRTVAPTTPLFSVAEAKRHLNVEHGEDDELLSSYIAAATSMAEVFTGRRFVTQTWQYYLDCFPLADQIDLPYPPLQSVTSLEYKQPSDGNYTVWSSSNYDVDIVSEPGRIRLANTVDSWPDLIDNVNLGVRITMVVGYDSTNPCDQLIVRAVKSILGHFYEHREDVATIGSPKEIPMNSRFALMPFKVFRRV